jgi:hypothetical protein
VLLVVLDQRFGVLLDLVGERSRGLADHGQCRRLKGSLKVTSLYKTLDGWSAEQWADLLNK